MLDFLVQRADEDERAARAVAPVDLVLLDGSRVARARVERVRRHVGRQEADPGLRRRLAALTAWAAVHAEHPDYCEGWRLSVKVE